MERKILILVLTIVLFPLAAQSEHEGYSNQMWSYGGDEFSVGSKDLSQKRSRSDLDDSTGLLSIGSYVRIYKNVNFRVKPAKRKIKGLKRGRVYQVLGVEVTRSGKRYYKVKDDLDVGYFYAGTAKNYKSWARKTKAKDKAEKFVADLGDRLTVKRSSGIKVYKDSKFESVRFKLPRNKKLIVKDVIESQRGDLVYYVQYKNKKGYIKAGDSRSFAYMNTWNELN